MNKAELIHTVSERTNIGKKEVETVLETMVELITEKLKAGDEVTISSFGAFTSRVRAARMGVNPQKPQERMQIPEVRVAKFKAGKGLKDALKGASQHPQPTP